MTPKNISNGKKIAQQSAPGRRCIFCEQKGISEEHIWPEWSHNLLPKPTSHVRYRLAAEPTQASEDIPIYKERQGPIFNVRVCCVCKKCNNGWMSQIDQEAKPIFIRVASDEIFELSLNCLERLTRWIVLKIMVIEQRTPALASFTDAQRRAFYESRSIPNGLDIRIFFVPDATQHTAYQRVSLNASSEVNKPAGKNVSHTILGFLSMTFSMYYKRDFARNLEFPPGIQVRMWPHSSPVKWPLRTRTTKEEIDRIGNLIPTLINDKRSVEPMLRQEVTRLIAEFGNQAPQHVKARIAELNAVGDVGAAAIWNKVLQYLIIT